MDLQLQAIVTILALINPAVCAAIFAKSTGKQTPAALFSLATSAAFTVLIILVLAALFGAKILHLFGVSLDSFSVAGGGVLAWIGFSMLKGSSQEKPETHEENTAPGDSISPLIMFAASPGTITGVITLAVEHSKLAIPVTALIAVGVATTVMWLVLLLSIYLGHKKEKKAGSSFVRDTITRFMGLIVIAMGIQFALTGIKAFMTH